MRIFRISKDFLTFTVNLFKQIFLYFMERAQNTYFVSMVRVVQVFWAWLILIPGLNFVARITPQVFKRYRNSIQHV